MKKTALVILILILVFISFTLTAKSVQQDGQPENPVVAEAVKEFRSGNVDKALELLTAELAAKPGDDEVHNALAIIYMNKNMNDKALEHFDRAIELKERNYKAINNKLGLLLTNEKIGEAIDFLGEINSQYPDYSTGWANKAALEMQVGRFNEAIESINKAIALDAEDYDAYFKRGQTYLLMRQYDKAEQDFDTVLRLKPDFRLAIEGKQIIDDTREKLAGGYIRVRQILVRSQELADAIYQELEKGASFAALARRYSVDPTARTGGALGMVKPGGLIAELENAMFSLEPGEYSAVIKSPLGFHIFLREE